MADSDAGPLPAIARIAALAADPDAPRWARDCAWIPDTGFCPERTCQEDCMFRAQRMTEARRVVRLRQARRPTQRPLAGRPVRQIAVTTGGRAGAVEV
jgi:hypothetical protein